MGDVLLQPREEPTWLPNVFAREHAMPCWLCGLYF